MRQVLALAIVLAVGALAGCGDASVDSNHTTIPKRHEVGPTPSQRQKIEYEQRAHTARGKPAAGAAGRAALVGDLERSILKDARARVRSHELKGPITRVACDATRSSDHVFSCTAVTQELKAVQKGKTTVNGVLGHPFTGAIQFATGEYAWCKRTLSPGEGGLIDPRWQVDLPRACRA